MKVQTPNNTWLLPILFFFLVFFLLFFEPWCFFLHELNIQFLRLGHILLLFISFHLYVYNVRGAFELHLHTTKTIKQYQTMNMKKEELNSLNCLI